MSQSSNYNAAIKFAFGLWVVIQTSVATADTHYVSLGGTNNWPYTNGWANASTNIQWAVTAAAGYGDTVLISNGTYYLTNQVSSTVFITIRGMTTNRDLVIVNGNYPKNTNRCFSLSDGTLANLTITNGFADESVPNPGLGGGVYFAPGTIQNCLITGNTATRRGGGAYNVSGTMTNCAVAGNLVSSNIGFYPGGGGIYCAGGTVRNCVVSNNFAALGSGGGIYHTSGLVRDSDIVYNRSSGAGGGLFVGGAAIVSNCLIGYNSVISGPGWVGGGGVYLSLGTVVRCRIVGNNSGPNLGGGLQTWQNNGQTVRDCQIVSNIDGGVYLFNTENSIILNSLISGNTSSTRGGGLLINYNGTAVNCTVVGNVSTNGGAGGVYCNDRGLIMNCIIYSNSVNSGTYSNWYSSGSLTFSNNCTTPIIGLAGTGNTQANPQFVDLATGNCQIRGSSPCANSGLYQDWMTNAVDLNGQPRIRYNRVDMGCYEAIFQGTVFKGK